MQRRWGLLWRTCFERGLRTGGPHRLRLSPEAADHAPDGGISPLLSGRVVERAPVAILGLERAHRGVGRGISAWGVIDRIETRGDKDLHRRLQDLGFPKAPGDRFRRPRPGCAGELERGDRQHPVAFLSPPLPGAARRPASTISTRFSCSSGGPRWTSG